MCRYDHYMFQQTHIFGISAKFIKARTWCESQKKEDFRNLKKIYFIIEMLLFQ